MKNWQTDDLLQKAQEPWDAVRKNREEYVAAWVAEHDCLPSECILVEQQSHKDGVITTTVRVLRMEEFYEQYGS